MIRVGWAYELGRRALPRPIDWAIGAEVCGSGVCPGRRPPSGG